MSELNDVLQLLSELSVNDGPLDPETRTRYVEPEPTTDEVDQLLRKEFLTPSNDLPWDLLNNLQSVPHLGPTDYSRIYSSLLVSPAPVSRTVIRSRRRGIGGEIYKYEEVFDRRSFESNEGAATAMNSLSMRRKFGSNQNAATGHSNFLPFQPGGLTEASSQSNQELFGKLHRDKDGLFDVPPGFSKGLETFDTEEIEDLPMLQTDLEGDDNSTPDSLSDESFDDNTLVSLKETKASGEKDIIDEIIPANSILVSKSHNVLGPATAKREWAHVVELSHKIENFEELVPNMARTWPFELDTFQQEAIYHLEQGDSVFVAAHTSAGKTVVAEYAIAMATRNMTKAIYTSPIKALSNQKFRDFKETFTDIEIGVLTGDVQINPDAGCLIMTTEILRSMLYRGADLIRDVEFVIFDEVHYVNDVDRGVVWEEVIIMLPDHVKVILLSATVPNTLEFASWVGRTKQKDIYVISTPKRPVPLEIYAFAKQKMFKLIDANRNFLKDGYAQHEQALTKTPEGSSKGGNDSSRGARGGTRGGRGGAVARGGARGARGGRGGNRGGSGRGGRTQFMQRDNPNKNSWTQLVQHLKTKDLLPAVIFVFSKKRCEEYADTLRSQDFCTAKEKSEIHVFITKSISRLKKEDRELPQILKVKEMLSRGIGLHHGGLLPIVKEFIEILFARGLLKVLFVTETFAMGLNLPTRTVVFSELRKHDGTGFRDLLPGEFTQMSGRAGRRGLDKIGTVIVMAYNLPIEQNSFRDVALGTPTKLVSQFRLTYNMILNLVRIEALKVEEMIKRSFSEDATQSLLPEHQKTATKLEVQLEKFPEVHCDLCDAGSFTEVFKLRDEYLKNYRSLIRNSMDSAYHMRKMKRGRLIFVREKTGSSEPAIIVRSDINTKTLTVLAITGGNGQKYPKKKKLKDVLQLPFMDLAVDGEQDDEEDEEDEEEDDIQSETDDTEDIGSPISALRNLENRFVPELFKDLTNIFGGYNRLFFTRVEMDQVDFVSNVEVKTRVDKIVELHDPKELDLIKKELGPVFEKQKSWRALGFNMLTPEMSDSLQKTQESKAKLLSALESILVARDKCSQVIEHLEKYEEKYRLEQELQSIQNLISDDNLDLLPDYEQRLRVLKYLDYINLDTTFESPEEDAGDELYSSRLTITLKGRVACEVNQGWELVVTELVLANFLGDLDPEELVALLSVFVYEGKRKPKGKAEEELSVPNALTPRLTRGQEKIVEIMKKVLGVYSQFQVNLTPDEESFLESNRFGLVNVVYQWAKGLSFKEIMELENQEVQESEGTIVRVISRLDEICRDVRNAALIIGDSQLHFKMEEAQEKIKRDIVFCASLYL
ncbi:unnamed protein product [Kuraishia capsulata CBS 1993]|uniref:Antiviral helicase SKI2 n=1 Tax=Kuraishia capsulata CBS 1993 TaxID=1382522 RepID=W6MGR9_9ASCO|nr:uncharacterized protein KUCA_T00000754001 [Kuraishia capsulata CBS 1993]CDK24788.1 unnamed protein product [Kuraishia capsulata CBS 1993]